MQSSTSPGLDSNSIAPVVSMAAVPNWKMNSANFDIDYVSDERENVHLLASVVRSHNDEN